MKKEKGTSPPREREREEEKRKERGWGGQPVLLSTCRKRNAVGSDMHRQPEREEKREMRKEEGEQKRIQNSKQKEGKSGEGRREVGMATIIFPSYKLERVPRKQKK